MGTNDHCVIGFRDGKPYSGDEWLLLGTNDHIWGRMINAIGLRDENSYSGSNDYFVGLRSIVIINTPIRGFYVFDRKDF